MMTVILALALCAVMYVLVISTLAVIFYWMDRSATLAWFVPSVPVLDLRAARLGGIA